MPADAPDADSSGVPTAAKSGPAAPTPLPATRAPSGRVIIDLDDLDVPTPATATAVSAVAPAANRASRRPLHLGELAILVLTLAAAITATVLFFLQQNQPPPPPTAGGDTAPVATPAASASEQRTEPTRDEQRRTRVLSGSGYRMRIPSGGDWSSAIAGSTPLKRTRKVFGPNGIVIRIVHTPRNRAQPAMETVMSDVPLAGNVESLRRLELLNFPVPECERRTCVDYVLNDPAFGGLAVLANGEVGSRADREAREIALSVRPS